MYQKVWYSTVSSKQPFTFKCTRNSSTIKNSSKKNNRNCMYHISAYNTNSSNQPFTLPTQMYNQFQYTHHEIPLTSTPAQETRQVFKKPSINSPTSNARKAPGIMISTRYKLRASCFLLPALAYIHIDRQSIPCSDLFPRAIRGKSRNPTS